MKSTTFYIKMHNVVYKKRFIISHSYSALANVDQTSWAAPDLIDELNHLR